MFFQRLRIKGRLYAGFGALVLFSLAVALFGIWQLSAIHASSARMASISQNTARALDIAENIQVIRQAMLHYSVNNDDASFKESAATEAKTLDLLQVIVKNTTLEERRIPYNNVAANIRQLGAQREMLGEAVKNIIAARATMNSAGGEIAADLTKLVQASRLEVDRDIGRTAANINADVLLVQVANLTFLANHDPAGIANFKDKLKAAQQEIDSLGKMDLPENIRALNQSTKTALTNYAAAFETISTNFLKAGDIYNNQILKLEVDSLQKLATMEDSLKSNLADFTGQTDKLISSTTILQAAIAALAALLGTLFAFFIARGISRPIQGMTQAMTSLAAGDLQVEVPGQDKQDEIGEMAKAVLVFRDAAVEKLRLEQEAAAERVHNEEAQRRAQEEAIAGERNLVTSSIGAGLAKLAAKDLTYRMSSDIPEAYRKLQSDFNAAIAQLEEALQSVTNSTDAIHSGTQDISSAADDLSRRTEQQAASLEETAAALEEITATVRKSAEGATHARQVVTAADGDAKKSSLVVRQAVEAMDAIAKSAAQISQIISVIDEIAFQTNLLALNAGVEAARAGDAGRGFAVVASEVRALAQRSAQAAKEIKGLISASTAQVDQGVKLVGETGHSLERMLVQVSEINDVVTAIASGAKEQATGLAEVNTAINQMDQVTQQNAAMVEQSTAASHSLSQETELLSGLIGQFQLGRAKDNNAIRRELQKVAPHAFQPTPTTAARGARVETRKPASAPARAKPKVMAVNGAAGAAEAGDWKEF